MKLISRASSRRNTCRRYLRFPHAVRHASGAPQMRGPLPDQMDPGSAAHRHSASQTRVNALMALRRVRGTLPLPEIQFLEEVVALVVNDDEGRKIHNLDPPDRFHP